MATLASLRSTTQTLLQDTAAARWSTADIDAYLNEGQLELNKATRLYKARFTVTASNGTATYAVSDANGPAIGPILRFETSAGVEIPRTTEERMDLLSADANWAATTGAAITRWMRGKRDHTTLLVYSIPTGAATYYAYAAATPPTMTSSGTPVNSVIPEQYTSALPHYAAYKCHSRSSDDTELERAAFHKARFDELVKQAQDEAAEV